MADLPHLLSRARRWHAPSWAAAAVLSTAVAIAGCDGVLPGRAAGGGRPLPVVHMFGEVGSSPGQFLYPRAMAADGRGWADGRSEGVPHLWVIDKGGRIQRLSTETGRAAIAFRAPDIALGRPCGITVAPTWRGGPTDGGPPTDLLYVADTHYHRVLIYAPPDAVSETADAGKHPRLVGQFGSYGQGPGEFIYLTDVAVLTDESGYAVRFYVGEYGGNDRISIWEPRPNGKIEFVGAFGRLGLAASEADDEIVFDRPQSLAIDSPRSRLVVTDSGNHRVGIFTLEGDLVRWIDGREGRTLNTAAAGADPEASTPEAARGMAYPFGLHVLEDGSALVTEFGGHCVRHLDLDSGRVLGLYGVGGRGPGELLNPWAVTMIDGTVFVLDSGNERIQSFKLARRGWSFAGGKVAR